MSKLETVQALDDSRPRLDLIQAMQHLEQTVQLLHQDTTTLPAFLAEEMATALEPLQPLLALPAQVRAMSTAQQNLIEVLVSQATADLRIPVGELSKELATAKTALGLLPEQLKKAITAAMTPPITDPEPTPEPPPPPSSRFWSSLLAATFGGVVVAVMVVGIIGWQRYESDELARLRFFDQVWERATAQEREMMQGISSRKQ